MVSLTGQERFHLRTQVDEANSLTINISLLARVVKGASKSGAQLPDSELIKEGLIAELTARKLRDIIQGQTSAALEPSLIIRSLYNMVNYVSLWAAYYDEKVIRHQLERHDLAKFSTLEDLRKKLIDDIEGKLFWDQYLKAGVMTCVLVAASAIAITAAGFGAPVSAFLIAQFTTSPTIATTFAAGCMLLTTSGIMCLNSGVRKAWAKVRSLTKKVKAERQSGPAKPEGVVLEVKQAPAHPQGASEKSEIVTNTGEKSTEKASATQVKMGIPPQPPHVEPTSKPKDAKKASTLHKRAATHGRHLRHAGIRHLIYMHKQKASAKRTQSKHATEHTRS